MPVVKKITQLTDIKVRIRMDISPVFHFSIQVEEIAGEGHIAAYYGSGGDDDNWEKVIWLQVTAFLEYYKEFKSKQPQPCQ